MIYFAYAMAWISTGIATATAVYITKSATPLWTMLIPAMISIKSNDSKIGE